MLGIYIYIYIYIGEDQECVVFLHMFPLIYIDVCAERDIVLIKIMLKIIGFYVF